MALEIFGNFQSVPKTERLNWVTVTEVDTSEKANLEKMIVQYFFEVRRKKNGIAQE
jgi:hypothetical protein